MSGVIDRTMVAENVLDRLDALESAVRDILNDALTPQAADPENPDWTGISGWVATGTSLRDFYGRIVLDATVPSITLAAGGIIESSDYIAATSGFHIDGGTAEFNDIVIRGTIYATVGAIGGWTIGATSLVAGTGANTVGLDSGGTNPAIYAGSATPGSAPFRVTQAGVLFAQGATIQSAASGARVVLDGTGIKGYDATTQRYQISNDGSGWLGSSSIFSWTDAGVVTLNGSAVMPNTIVGGKVNFFNVPIIDGLVITNNSPGAGQVAWSSFTLTHLGVSYTVSAGNTANKFIYWNKATSTTVLQTSATPPAQAVDQFIVIFNEGGTGVASLFSNIVYADYISVVNLAAINAAMGNLTVDGTLTMATGGVLKSGQTAYDTGTGFWLAYNAGIPRFSLGNSAGNKMTWDGTSLNITGNLIIGPGVNFGASGVMLHCPFDGPLPYETDYQVNTSGHLGQVATVTGGVIGRPGKFGKAVQVAEATTNLVTNPSFETNTTGWTPGAGNSITRSTDFAHVGSYSAKCIEGGGSYFVAAVNYIAGQSYVLSLCARRTDGAAVTAADIYNLFIENTAVATASITLLENGWYKIISAVRVAAATASNNVGWYLGAGRTLYVDAIQVEQKAYATPYCDGSLGTGHTWSGTAHASTSARTAGQVSYSNINVQKVGSISLWTHVLNPAGLYFCVIDSTVSSVWLGYGSGALYAGWYGSVVNAGTMTAGWHHLVVTCDGTTVKVYLDGAYQSSVAVGSTVPGTGIQLAYPGLEPGLVDDLVIFDHALTADEVKQLYTSNTPITVSASPFQLMLTGQGLGKIVGNANGIYGYDAAGTLQTYMATDGKMYAGAGSVVLDSGGVWLNTPASYNASAAVKFASTDLSTLYSKVYAYHDALTSYLMLESLYADNGLSNRIGLVASNSTKTTYVTLHPGYDALMLSGGIATGGGTTVWNLGAYQETAYTPDCSLRVTVGGVLYDLPARVVPV